MLLVLVRIARLILLCLLALLASSAFAEPNLTAPHRGGTLKLAFAQDFRSLDPALSYDNDSVPVTRLLFRSLIDYDESGETLVAAQSHDWNISSDGKTYTFHLKPGVRFSNGREVEAADYVFSLERVLNPSTGSQGQTYFLGIRGAPEFIAGKASHVAGLQAVDPQTLRIELAEPAYTFRHVMAGLTFASVVPRDVVQQTGADFRRHLVGSGPYRVTESQQGIRWKLERNPYYSGPSGYVDNIEITLGPDPTTIAMMIERGEVHYAQVEAPTAARFKRDPARRSWLSGCKVSCTQALFLNTEMPPFDNVLVRRAVAYAINKERIVRLVAGWGQVASGTIPPIMPWSNPGCPSYEYAPDKARALLAQAGLPHGFKTEMWEFPGYYERIAQAIQQDLHQVGIEAEIRTASFPVYQDKVTRRGVSPCTFWGWTQDYPDPSNFLDVLFNGARITDTDSVNRSFYNNPNLNLLLDQARKSLIPRERTELFRKAEALVMDDLPWVPVLHPIFPMLRHPSLHDPGPHPVWLWQYERMWLDP